MAKIADPYLEDILDSIQKIESYLSKIDFDKALFEADIEKQDAVIRRLEIIGEATKRLSDGFRTEYSHIPWKQMAGMRDVLAHDYDQVDLDMIWEVMIKDLPVLKQVITNLLK